MRQRHAPQTQGRHKLLPAQADIQVCRDREYQQLEKNCTQVFLFAGMLAVYFVLLDGSSYFINALGAQNV